MNNAIFMTKIWDLGRGREIKKEIKMAWLRDSVELQILNWKRGGGGVGRNRRRK